MNEANQTDTNRALSVADKNKILNLFRELANQTELCTKFARRIFKFQPKKLKKLYSLTVEYLEYKRRITDSELFSYNFKTSSKDFERIAINSKTDFVNLVRELILELNKKVIF